MIFSSDGFIRDKLKEISETRSPGSIAELNDHLIKNKKPIDDTLLNILITDINGIVVGATDLEELGKDESDDEYIIGGERAYMLRSFRSTRAILDWKSEP